MSIRSFLRALTPSSFWCRPFIYPSISLLLILFFSISLVEPAKAQAQPESSIRPELVADINSDTPGSDPRSLVVMGDMMYFAADDGEHGISLWRSDGTETGTQLVKDFYPDNPDARIVDIIVLNDKLVILARPTGGAQSEIWSSDGTEEGTKPLIIESAEDTYWYSAFVVVDDLAYFILDRDATQELWRTDGTGEDTFPVFIPDTIDSNGNQLSSIIYLRLGDQLGGKLYFWVEENSREDDFATPKRLSATIWTSDGSMEGTIPVVEIDAQEYSWAITSGSEAFYFVTFNLDANSASIWKSDGTELNTIMVKEITPNFPLRPTSWEDIVWNGVFYVGIRQDDLYQGELWKSDGTNDGTVLIDTVCAENFFPFNDEMFFSGDECDGDYQAPMLWKTDGTSAGTTKVKEVFADRLGPYPEHFVEMDGYLYFNGTTEWNGDDSGLWRTDGTTAGTEFISPLFRWGPYSGDTYDEPHIPDSPNYYGSRRAIVLGTKLYYSTLVSSTGNELYSSDGTREGTQLVKDINSSRTFSSYPEQITAFGERVCLRTADRVLTCSDDNVEHFQPVSGYWGWDPYENAIAATTSHLYWLTNDQLWSTEGVVLSTSQLTFESDDSNVQIRSLTAVDDRLYFIKNGDLWISDGTDIGTRLIMNNDSYNIGMPLSAAFNGDLFFVKLIRNGWNENFIGEGTSLWKSDGMLDLVEEILPNRIYNLVAGVTNLYYLTSSEDFPEQYELWRSDGTTDGAVKLTEIKFPNQGYYKPETRWLVDNDTVYFVATDDVHGTELWKSDGTSDGTNIILDLIPGTDTAYPMLLTASENVLYFTTLSQSDNSAWDLWRSDGTADGTHFVKQFTGVSSPYYVGPYGTSVSPFNIKAEYWNGYLVMMLQRQTSETDIYGDTVFQSELWVSKGMAESTKRVLITDSDSCRDENENPRPCSLMLHPTRNQVFFTAFDDTHGYELWTLVDDSTEPATPTPTNTSEPTPTPTSTPEPIEPTSTPVVPPTNTPTPIPPDTPTPTPTTTPDPTPTPIVETPAPTVEPVPETPTPISEPVVSCGPLEQEAEAGELSGKWIVGDDAIASGGQYITIPDTDELNAAAVNPNSASYCFTVSEVGTYRLLGWAYAADGQDNSLFVSLDGQLLDGQPLDEFAWELPISTDYTADYANSRGGDDPVEFTLEPGEQTVTLTLREDGLRVDKLALVRIDGSQPVLAPPMPASCSPLGSEAEEGTFYGNFAIGSDKDASGGQFVSVPDVLRSGNAALQQQPNSRHRVDYCITVAETGDYRLRTQVLAPDYRANSFYVQINGAPEAAYLYDVYPVGETYSTDYVNDRNGADPVIYSLDAGPHVVSFILREDGTRLDSFALESVNAQVASTMSPTPLQVEENSQAEEGTAEIKLYLPLLQ